jgi:hypothetical protein
MASSSGSGQSVASGRLPNPPIESRVGGRELRVEGVVSDFPALDDAAGGK